MIPLKLNVEGQLSKEPSKQGHWYSWTGDFDGVEVEFMALWWVTLTQMAATPNSNFPHQPLPPSPQQSQEKTRNKSP